MRSTQKVNTLLAGSVFGLALIVGPSSTAQSSGLPGSTEPNPTSEGRIPVRLTLKEALDRALTTSPSMRAMTAHLARVTAEQDAVRTYPHHPEVELSAGKRSGPSDSASDRSFEFSQVIEVGGQGRKRRAAADATERAARLDFDRESRLLAAEVELAFATALRTRELLLIAAVDAQLATQLLAHSERRLEAGSGTQVELNLARSTAGQAERSRRLSEAAASMALHQLSEIVGLDPTQALVGVVGEQPIPEAGASPLEELWAQASAGRRDLAAQARLVESSKRSVGLARSERIPNLQLGAFYEKEEDDEIVGLSVSLPIPLFNRGRAAVARAEAESEFATAHLAVRKQAVQREISDALVRFTSAREAALYLRDLVVGTLEDNLTLLQKALDAGKVGASDVLVFRREFVEGQRQYVEALFEAQSARIELDLATGQARSDNSSRDGVQR